MMPRSVRLLNSIPAMEQSPPDPSETAVVIDALRATTSMVAALAAGARAIWPCREVDEARQWASLKSGALLAGERQGLPLPGFDFGNSPAEFTASRLAGRELVFTTSNGTRAILACASAKCVMLAAMTNLRAVVKRLVAEPRIVIACAGANDCESLEDLLVAGAIIQRLRVALGGAKDAEYGTSELASSGMRDHVFGERRTGDGGEVERARCLWLEHSRSPRELEAAFHASPGGRHLHEIGMQADIPLSLEIDRFDLVPIFVAATKCVTAGGE